MLATAALAIASLLPAQPAAPAKFEIKDGDRIVWIGNTLVEREQRYGYWETALHAAFPDKQFTLRNLGWSGDTVFGDARAGFENAAKGYERLVSLTLELKPTIIFVSYGTNESFEGEAGLPKFEKGLEKLLDSLKPAKARVVLFTPLPAETHPRFSHAKDRNAAIEKYGAVIRKVAADRKLSIADLYRTVIRQYDRYEELRQHRAIDEVEAFTENGMHLTEHGYHTTRVMFLQGLGLVGELPACTAGLETPAVLKMLKKDLEPLRKAVIAKNELFFYRWRPQNETYLFGFRKHEQGKNAKEVAEFDPLVAKAEEEIETIRKKLTD